MEDQFHRVISNGAVDPAMVMATQAKRYGNNDGRSSSPTDLNAAMAYDIAAYELRGDAVHLNFPHAKQQLHAAARGPGHPHATIASLLEAKLKASGGSATALEKDLLRVGIRECDPPEMKRYKTTSADSSPAFITSAPGKEELQWDAGGVTISRMPSLDMIWDSLPKP